MKASMILLLISLITYVRAAAPPGMCSDYCLSGKLAVWDPDCECCDCKECTNYDLEINYPACTPCKVGVQCNGHASSVSTNGDKTKCVCECKDGWSGEYCDVCDDSKCGARSTGIVTGTTCSCQCKNHWSGTNCDACPDVYESTDCLTCKASYIEEGGSCRQCTISADCSNQASAVSSNAARSACTCTCTSGFGGASCNQCAQGYVNYPKCQECTKDVCNYHAKTISSSGNQCICSCAAGYKGTYCDECDEGHINYPDCTQCTTTKDCSSRADSVYVENDQCKCKCRNQWGGAICAFCTAPYAGADCNSCDEEHINYPQCNQACTLSQCGGGTLAVRAYANTQRTQCMCQCLDDYEGDTCNVCKAGLVGTPPNCQQCTLTPATGSSMCVDGHASDITSDTGRTKCVCICKDAYEGDTCADCAAGYINYPTCTQCTSKTHCSDHASSVTSNDARTSCQCTCRNQYLLGSGDCAVCPNNYEGDCDACAAGYYGYPGCARCDIAQDCNGHATSVTSNAKRTACVCTCAEGYEGSSCNKCADGYVEYPTCRKCDLVTECGDRATDVYSNTPRTECVCKCKPQYEGTKCDKCAAGFIGTPPACKQCTSDGYCSGNADSVTDDGTRTKCMCNCRNYWMEEDSCMTCNSTYTGADCDQCSNPKGVLPSCNQCNVAEHCHGHATSVVPKPNGDGCLCQCSNMWEGDTCGVCPGMYDPNKDCGACKQGLVGYPNCRECSIDLDCSGHAESVTGDPTGTRCVCKGTWFCPDTTIYWGNETCHCKNPNDVNACPCGQVGCQFSGTCNNRWSGIKCDYCAPQFYGTDCNQCNDNYIRYPWCRSCMEGGAAAAFARYGCNADRTADVVSNSDKTDCRCGCKARYETTEYSYEPCDRCAYGYIHYPDCDRCTSHDHCSNHAISVGSDANRTRCVCQCSPEYESTETGSQGCDCCSANHINYPECELCTIAKHCSNNAIAVTDNGVFGDPMSRTGCNCTCYAQWEGDDCSVCPPQFDSTNADCDKCAPGRIVYPYCYECTDATHCNGHSVSVAPDPTQQACVCQCRNMWGGSHGTCRTCSSPYTGADCDQCDNGGTMPGCNRACTVPTNCHNNAFSVQELPGGGCKCDCRHNWQGTDCSICPPEFGGSDCNECGVGLFRRSDGSCAACTNQAYCNGRACEFANCVQTTASECLCTGCKGNWQGAHCELCPEKYGGVNCDKCADGRTGYPTCDQCPMTVCRDGRAAAMGTRDDGTCYCKCKVGYAGDLCESCAPGFQEDGEHCICPPPFAGDQCNKCLPGYYGFPDCRTCSAERHCYNRAERVTSDGYSCECECYKQWCGGYGKCRAKGGYGYPVVDVGDVTGSSARTRTETLTLTLTLTVTESELEECGLGRGEHDMGISRTPTLTLVPEDEDEASNWWVWLLVGMLLCCVITILGVLARRRRNKDCAAIDNSQIMLPLQNINKDEEQELFAGDEMPEMEGKADDSYDVDINGDGVEEQPDASVGSVGELQEEASMGSAPDDDDDLDDRRDV